MTTTTKIAVPEVVTADWLRGIGACARHVERFAAEWPEGAELTPGNMARAAVIGLGLNWLASRVLPPTVHREYLSATSGAWTAYWRQVAGLPDGLEREPAAEAYRLQKAAALAAILCPEA